MLMSFKLFGTTLTLAIAVSGTALVFGHSGTSQVNQAIQQEQAGSQEQAKAVTIKGQVTGGGGNVLTVTDAQKAEHKLTVTADTKITKGGKAATLADLKMNDTVTVQAAPASDGTLTATSIDIAA
jgi:hypothetical protein